jgi:hypothetical protein
MEEVVEPRERRNRRRCARDLAEEPSGGSPFSAAASTSSVIALTRADSSSIEEEPEGHSDRHLLASPVVHFAHDTLLVPGREMLLRRAMLS